MGGRERAREMRRNGPRLTAEQLAAADRVLALFEEAALEGRDGGATALGGGRAACEPSGGANGPGTGEEAAWR